MKKIFAAMLGGLAVLVGCSQQNKTTEPAAEPEGANHADWSRNAVIYEVNTRQYTPEGTFNAFREHLPRLKELGVDILWFMPIHPISEKNRKGELGSYYAVRDYKAVNPEFGTLDDFKTLVDSVHAAGMKVIIDWVPNHTGCDNAWVEEHPEYYQLNEEGQMYGPFDWTDVYQLDYSNDSTRAAMTDAMKFWISEMGIDGFRCDVAGRVPVDYWNQARKDLEAAAGDRPIFMLAEATEPELVVEAFDMDYNWPMKDLFSEIAATSGQYTFKGADGNVRTFPHKTARDIDSLLAVQAEQDAPDSYMMNMITNHDLNSWEGTEFERLGNLQGAFAVLSYTLPGMPLIYTGQETGLDRALEFFVKDNPPAFEPRNDYFTFYQKLNSLKHNRPELAAGKAGAPVESYPTANENIYVFSRDLNGSQTVVAVNLGAEESALFQEGQAPQLPELVDAFTGQTATLPATLAPGQYVVLSTNSSK